jgi:hypothetical protein
MNVQAQPLQVHEAQVSSPNIYAMKSVPNFLIQCKTMAILQRIVSAVVENCIAHRWHCLHLRKFVLDVLK